MGMVSLVCSLPTSLESTDPLGMAFEPSPASVNGLCVLIDIITLALLDKTASNDWKKLYSVPISSEVHTCTEADDARDSIFSTHHDNSTTTPGLVLAAVKIKIVATFSSVEDAKDALKRAQEL